MKELQRLFLQKMSEIAIRHSLPRAVSQASCVLLSLAFCSLWSQASFGQTEIRKLTASDAGSPDRFGESVAISEELVVVGAIGNFVGAVYVFDRNHTGTDMWGEVVKLTAPSAGNFGFSVATDGDLVAVGNLELGGAGGINVFARNNGGPGAWGLVATQTASDGANLDRLGRSITLNGDVIVAGASDHNTDGLSNAGAAYVFGRNEGGMNNWGEITKLTASVPISGQRFGWRIDMSGNTIVVGGPFVQSFGEGSAYVFENIGGTWTETAVLTASDGEAGDEFGRAVVIAGDQILVGAPGWDGTFSFVGAVYVYARNEGGAGAWGQVTRLEASDGDFGDNFGRAIGLKCDQAAISARVASNPDGVSAGAIYLFHNGADGWTETAKFGASDGVFGHDLGSSSVAIDCDLIIAGAPDDDHAGIQSGSAYLFRVPSAGAPSCAGDIDGDGIVGVPDLLTVLGAWGPCP